MSYSLHYLRNGKAHDLVLLETTQKNSVLSLNGRTYVLMGDVEESRFLMTHIKNLPSHENMSAESFKANLLKLGIEKESLVCPLFVTVQKVEKIGPSQKKQLKGIEEEVKQTLGQLWKQESATSWGIGNLHGKYVTDAKIDTYENALQNLEDLYKGCEKIAQELNLPVDQIKEKKEAIQKELTPSNFKENYRKSAISLIKELDLKCFEKFQGERKIIFEHLIENAQFILKDKFSDKEMLKKAVQKEVLNTYLSIAVEMEHFSGVARVSKDGETLLNQGFGVDSKDSIHVASVTKQFTAAAIMLLKEEGKIKLDASINDYLPKKYQSAKWSKVTVHHLLSHTGGIYDYTVELSGLEKENYGFFYGNEVTKMIRQSQMKGLEFEPGSQMNYSNLGYTLLGIIIEEVSQTEVSQTSYRQFVQERLLKPLEMKASGIHDETYTKKANHATGHRFDEKRGKLVADDVKSLAVTSPDGGLYTSGEDLFKWSRLLSGQTKGPLDPKSIQLMTTPTDASLVERLGGYGYGLGVEERFGTKRIWHPGWIPGFRSIFSLYPEKDIQISLLCNNTSASPEQIVHGVEEILFLMEQ